MNILIIPSWYESDNNKISGSFFKEQAIALQKAGHNVSIAYVYMRTVSESFVKDIFRITVKEENGVKIYIYQIPSFGSIKRGTWFTDNVKHYRKLLRFVMKQEAFDLIHVHSFIPAGYAVCMLKEELGLPIFYTEHFSRIQSDNLNDQQRDALRVTVTKADEVIAVSNSLAEAMKKYSDYEGTIEVIPNILNAAFSNAVRTETGPEFRFITVGGLIKRKRHHITIQAFHEAFDNGKKVTLEIIGEGIEKQKLEQQIADLGEQERIHLAGGKGRQEVAQAMKNSNAFVLPSANETFGVVYIEAMAAGLPVIGTHNGGFDEIYFEGCGYIEDVDDLQGIVNAMKNMYQSSQRFNGTEISRHCVEHYGETAIVTALENCYREFFKGGH